MGCEYGWEDWEEEKQMMSPSSVYEILECVSEQLRAHSHMAIQASY